jgi:hypothetical protein
MGGGRLRAPRWLMVSLQLPRNASATVWIVSQFSSAHEAPRQRRPVINRSAGGGQTESIFGGDRAIDAVMFMF